MTSRAAILTTRRAPVLARSFTASAAAREEYDVAILGGGPGGYVAAIKASQLGLKTVCIEGRGTLGGTCLNVGCIPSKSLLQSTHMYEDANEHFAAHGVNVEGLSYDLDVMMGAKRDVVKGLTGGIEGLFKKNKTDYVKGWGKFIGTNEISVELLEGGNQTVKAKNIIIAAGSEVMPLPPVPVDNEALKIVDSTGALELKEVPKSMVVIGGGYIGLEMGSVWRRLGTEVTVVEFMDTLVPAMDTEVTKMFTRILKKQGMKFKLGQKVTASEVTPDGVKLTLEPAAGGDTTEMLVDVALVSTGRRPLTHGIGLEDVGIQLSDRGEVVVDDHFRYVEASFFVFCFAFLLFCFFVLFCCCSDRPSHSCFLTHSPPLASWTQQQTERTSLPSTRSETASAVRCSRTRRRRRASPRSRSSRANLGTSTTTRSPGSSTRGPRLRRWARRRMS